MVVLTGEQWSSYLVKYEKLMWKISQQITGDSAICDLEDNFADLCQTALESINGFHKKTGVSFDVMMEMKLFSQYTKTCLWHKKGNKGTKVKKRYPITNNTVSASDHTDLLYSKESSSLSELSDLSPEFSKLQKIIIDCIVKDPSHLLDNGRVNSSSIARQLKMPIIDISKEVKRIGFKVKNTL